MKKLIRRYRRQVVIFLVSLLISVLLILLLIIGVYNKGFDTDLFSDVTLRDINPSVVPYPSQEDSVVQITHYIDSSEAMKGNSAHTDYYIIVGSFNDLQQAQQKAKELRDGSETNIIVLPATSEGYYRVSYGKYSTLEKVNSTIKSIRKEINSEAWILSLKE